MSASTTNAYVGITLTPADRNVVAQALRTDVAAECQQVLAAPLPDREDVVRLRALLDVYARQIEALGWGNDPADIEMDCPADQLESVGDLPSLAVDKSRDHRLAVCAVLEHFLRELRGAQAA